QVNALDERSELIKQHLHIIVDIANQVNDVKDASDEQTKVNSEANKNNQCLDIEEPTITDAELANEFNLAREHLLINLSNWLDPVILNQLNAAKEDGVYITLPSDGKIVRNYKIILNVLTAITNLSEQYSLVNLMNLERYLEEIRLSEQLQISSHVN